MRTDNKKAIPLKLLIVFLLSFQTTISKGQNLLDLSGWTIGQGSSGIFNQNGGNSENIREWGEAPNGSRAILWKSTPFGDGHDDGGWNTNTIAINYTKMYRFTVWIKKTNSNNGITYFGCENVNDLNAASHPNPYFWNGSLPQLNNWYLLVGYIHGSGDASTTHYGGIYDGLTGIKVASCTDFQFSTQSTWTYHRTYLYYDPNTNDRQYFYAPRIDEVNGNEPSVSSLLAPSINHSGNALFSGKVGIQTADPGSYELVVNGEIRAKEVRVETGWSDFVFEKDYPLLSLKELEAYIKSKSHLPSIPSSDEVAKNGIDIGSINSKLLQKIEELTLYIIQINKEMKLLKSNSSTSQTK